MGTFSIILVVIYGTAASVCVVLHFVQAMLNKTESNLYMFRAMVMAGFIQTLTLGLYIVDYLEKLKELLQ